MKRWSRIAIYSISILLVSGLLIYFVPTLIPDSKISKFIHIIEIEALLLSIFALIFALKQYHDSVEHSAALREQTLALRQQTSALQEQGASLADQTAKL